MYILLFVFENIFLNRFFSIKWKVEDHSDLGEQKN
jgi:hypothetical protein